MSDHIPARRTVSLAVSLCFGQSAKQASATNFSESRAGAAVSIRLLRQKKKKEEAEGNATHRPNLTTIFSCTRHIKSARDVLFGQFCLRFRLLASTRHFQSENGDASASPTCLVPLCSPQKYTDPIAPRCVTQSPPAELPKIQISRLSRRTLVAAQEITTQIRPWPGRIRPDPATINCT